MATVFERIKNVIETEVPSYKDDITMKTDFRRDLDLDPAELSELLVAFDEEFETDIPGEDFMGLNTVENFMKYLQEEHDIEDE